MSFFLVNQFFLWKSNNKQTLIQYLLIFFLLTLSVDGTCVKYIFLLPLYFIIFVFKKTTILNIIIKL
jgi:hypothetical protein